MPTPNDRGPHRPRTNIQYHVENGWAVPDQPQPPRRTSTQELIVNSSLLLKWRKRP